MDKTIQIEKLKQLALNLKFDMEDKQYHTLQKEFEIILKQMESIDKDFDTEKVEPMSFPFENFYTYLRDDEEIIESPREEILKNAKTIVDGQIKINKVVE